MRKIAPFSPTRIVLAVLVGVVAFVIQTSSVWFKRTGDDPARIKEVSALLEQLRKQSKPGVVDESAAKQSGSNADIHVTRLIPLGKTVWTIPIGLGTEASTGATYKVTRADGTFFFVQANHEPTEDELHAVWQQEVKWREQAVKWREIEAASYQLTRDNGQVLRAKALQYLSEKPGDYFGDEWESRFQNATRDFSVCTTAERFWRSTRRGALAFVIAAPLTWLALLVFSWPWYFVVDRLRAIWEAIRSKMEWF
jgi:hypothetical protein